jgi:hypothetical protein
MPIGVAFQQSEWMQGGISEIPIGPTVSKPPRKPDAARGLSALKIQPSFWKNTRLTPLSCML